MQAALFELLAAATWAGVVPPDTLERINKRRRRVCVGQSAMPRTGGPLRPILLGRIGEGVPAREPANRILKRPNQVVVEARHALGIGQGSLEIPAKIIVAHHHGVIRSRSKAWRTTSDSSSRPSRAMASTQPLQTKLSCCGCNVS